MPHQAMNAESAEPLAPASTASPPPTSGYLAIGERFFDPDCGEDFEKVDHCTGRFMTGGDVFEGEHVEFASEEPVQRLAAPNKEESSAAAATPQRGERG